LSGSVDRQQCKGKKRSEEKLSADHKDFLISVWFKSACGLRAPGGRSRKGNLAAPIWIPT
jgi:hypothetical protein